MAHFHQRPQVTGPATFNDFCFVRAVPTAASSSPASAAAPGRDHPGARPYRERRDPPRPREVHRLHHVGPGASRRAHAEQACSQRLSKHDAEQRCHDVVLGGNEGALDRSSVHSPVREGRLHNATAVEDHTLGVTYGEVLTS